MRVERGEAHEEERKHEKDEDKPPECVNHTHGQRDGEGAHKKKKKQYKSAKDRGIIGRVSFC